MTLPHPDPEQIDLANVLTALGDDTRLAILGKLAICPGGEMTCGQFTGVTSKTAFSYHLARLREAGVVHVRPQGTRRLVSLRRDDLDKRFPGFLDSILDSAVEAARRVDVPSEHAASPAELGDAD